MSLNHASRIFLKRYALRSNVEVCHSLGCWGRSLVPSVPVKSGAIRQFADSNPGIFDRVKDSFEERSNRKQAEKYAEHLQKMADSETWTLRNFMNELQEAVPTGWRSKIPGVGNTQQVKAAKEAQTAVEGIVDEVGGDATVEDLENMGRKEKLKISIKTNVSIQEINSIVKQFKGMEIMHQVLRRQKLSGKPIPKDEEGMKALFEAESTKVLSKSQRRALQKSQMERGFGIGRIN